ncbi:MULTISPECIES: hypothetical protein [unclassified Aurantimonas]|uniref:hypothetical protein n=1 Tax=unclassified Aurantimonas TaxID=2638230 RepID=UPI002E170618|nr:MULTISPECIES: hypothetical protein [unclassified Aurantimonas]MEC5289408.1 hypothetical protein [Aurantimonas sp. C2-3-R2]MEC5410488.1 hypothetical protein [Aurantimonas sp. C2-4-R8]
MTDTSLPEVRAWPWGRGYHAHFRKPGGSWQFVREIGTRKAAVFPTSEAAKDAATAIVFRFMCPEIKALPAEPNAMEKRLLADTSEFRERRDEEARRLRSETFTMRKAGRKPVVVETKRRAG